VNLPRFLDHFLPAALLAMLPVDILVGIIKGLYPTQASLSIWLGSALGVMLLRSLSNPRHAKVIESGDPELLADAVVNRQLNFGLGATLLGLSLVMVFFGLVMVAILPVRPLPFSNLTLAKGVELGFILLFNLMIGGLEAFAARIYLMGRAKL
jgi:hypothetical protein